MSRKHARKTEKFQKQRTDRVMKTELWTNITNGTWKLRYQENEDRKML